MTDVIAGQTVALLSQWYAYQGGPLTDLDATPTIGITRVSDGAVILAPTAGGVTHPGVGSYGYGWTPAVDLAPGLYLALWSGLSGGSPVSATETITVVAAVTGRVHATALEYQAYTGLTPPADINARLARASRFLGSNVFRLCWYEVNEDGSPSNAIVAAAFAAAVCAQVQWWDETGDELGAGGRYASVKLGSLALSRASSASGSAPAAGREVAETALEALRSEDLTPDIFVLGMVAQC